GITEEVDKVAGHIPGAYNLFWKDNIDTYGKWKSIHEQVARFCTVVSNKNKEVIVYCGSGVTACPNIIALREAGYTNVRLYAGSWSDWISYDDNPIEVVENKNK